MPTDIRSLLGSQADALLNHESRTLPRSAFHLPGPDFVDRVFSQTDRSPVVLRNLQTIFNTGRLAKTGFVSILPVDQGVEHSAGASFAPNPAYFDPENIVKLAIEGGCNAVASTIGVLGSVARKYAHKIPFLAKFNHNEMLTYPNIYKQILTSYRSKFPDVMAQEFYMGKNFHPWDENYCLEKCRNSDDYPSRTEEIYDPVTRGECQTM